MIPEHRGGDHLDRRQQIRSRSQEPHESFAGPHRQEGGDDRILRTHGSGPGWARAASPAPSFIVVPSAIARGFYAVPRQTDLATLAHEAGVSKSAFSERLRSAERKLFEGMVGA